MSLAVGISTYGNPKGLNDTLASVYPLADQTVVIHGRYLGFPGLYPHSEDQTKARISAYPNTTLICNSIPRSQVECRNQYLKEAKCDFLLIMDDDEYVYDYSPMTFKGQLNKFKKEHEDPEICTIWYLHQNGVPNSISRLLYKPAQFRYLDNHFHFAVDGIYVGASGRTQIDGLMLAHRDGTLRPSRFEKEMEQYEIWQHYNEKQY